MSLRGAAAFTSLIHAHETTFRAWMLWFCSVAFLFCAFFFCGCGSAGADGFGRWFESRPSWPEPRSHALSFRWRRSLTSADNDVPYRPLERAAAAVDPARDRVYVGSSQGSLWAFSSAGQRIYRYNAGESLENEPALDPDRDELFFGTEEGRLHAIRASTGQARWRTVVGGPLRQLPLLTPDAVYVVTETDVVTAVSRQSGEVLWRYRRDPPDGFSITGHAGLLIHEGIVVTGFTDGVLAGLDATDGRVIWERDTDVDVEAESTAVRFRDVNTTPVLFEGDIWAASVGAGLYRLNASNGSVLYRDPSLTGVTAILGLDTHKLVLAQSQEGLVCIDANGQTVWRRPLRQGAANAIRSSGHLLVVGESEGALVAFHAESGQELGRIDAGTGFSGPIAVALRRGFALSNGGSLLAFDIGASTAPRQTDWLEQEQAVQF